MTELQHRIEQYILWLAPALIIQYLAHYFSRGPGLEHLSGPAAQILLQPSDVISIAGFAMMLPKLVTALWVSLNSGSSTLVKVAWFVSGFFLSYLVLVPFLGYLLLGEQRGSSNAHEA